MKKSLLFIFTLVVYVINSHASAQNINIPDANFKSILISKGIDTNGDGEIQESEALAVTSLVGIDSEWIRNLIGIKYFTNLDSLTFNLHGLTSLDISGLPNLTYLHLFTKLPYLDISNMPKLEYFDCELCWSDSINLTNTNNLKHVNLFEASFKSLDISKLSKLEYLDIFGNYISELDVSNSPNLKYLDCSGNYLTHLDLSKNPNLETLICSESALTHIDFSGTYKLESLFCDRNKLTSLDLSSTKVLKNLSAWDNPLITVYLKNGVKDNYEEISLLTNTLKYICTDDEDIDDLTKIIRPNVIINSLCGSTLDGAFSTISGDIKVDRNNDGCDESDMYYPYLKVLVTTKTDTGYIFSGADGNFSINLKSDTTKFVPVLENLNYYSVTPESAVYTLANANSPSFCITPKGNFNDLAVSIIPVIAARPGFSDAQYKIVYKNQGTTTQSGNVTFQFDDNKMNVLSSSPAADQSDFGLLTFNFSNLAPFESKSILVTMRTNAPTDNPAVNVNDVLNFSANITAQTDETPEDNTAVLYQTVIGSYDPNDKTCLEGDIITPDMVGKRANYLIRFENTGTANAENVVVTDYIDTTVFNVNSLLVTDASHQCHTQISNGNKVQFIFSDIQLPFTEPNKHGYVAFSILLKDDLQIGDSIKNYADIYFDYNLPITTNEAISEVKNRVITTVKQKISDIQLSVYPNPSKGNFSLELKSNNTAPVQITVIDIEGKIVFAKQYAAQQNLIPLQLDKLAKGTYLIQAQSENDMVSRKIVIQ